MTGDWQTVCFCPAADHPHHHGEGECPNGLAYIAAPRQRTSSPSDDVKYAVDTHPGHDVERAYIATLEEQGVLTEAQADDLRWLVDDGADRVIAYRERRLRSAPDLRAAVEGLPDRSAGPYDVAFRMGQRSMRDAVLDLIPEGAVLVTQDELAEALYSFHSWDPSTAQSEARSIWDALARLRSRPSPTEEKG